MFSYKQEIGITFESKSQRTVLDQRQEEWLEELVVKKKKTNNNNNNNIRNILSSGEDIFYNKNVLMRF